MRPSRVLAVSAGAAGLLGLAVFLGLSGPPGMVSPVAPGLPRVTLAAVVLAGLADGFNPCAFTVLLLFITSLLAAAQPRAVHAAEAIRRRVTGLGSIYIASVFLTYLALGVASARPTLNRLARWNLHHREHVRLGLGSGVVVMGFAILVTV